MNLDEIRRVWAIWRSGERPDAAQRLLHQDVPNLIARIDVAETWIAGTGRLDEYNKLLEEIERQRATEGT